MNAVLDRWSALLTVVRDSDWAESGDPMTRAREACIRDLAGEVERLEEWIAAGQRRSVNFEAVLQVLRGQDDHGGGGSDDL